MFMFLPMLAIWTDLKRYSKIFLFWFGHSSKAPWKVGGGRKFKELSIFGWSYKKPGRRCQVEEPARLFKDFGGTRGEVGNPRPPYRKLALQRLQGSRERKGVHGFPTSICPFSVRSDLRSEA